jgi:hypothetical protein
VLHSTHFADAIENLGVTMHGFWSWFTRDVALFGGADALAIFAHPGREPQKFEGFRFVPEAAERVVGVEVYNRANEYFTGGLAEALDAGWHVGAIGSADDHGPNWGRADRSRTVLLVPETASREAATVRDALLSRRFYATFNHDLRLRVRAGDAEMGSRLEGPAGEPLSILVEAYDPVRDDSIVGIELYTNGGTLLAAVEVDPPAGDAQLQFEASFPAEGEAWYVARVLGATALLGPERGDAFASPLWLRPAHAPE